MRWRRSACEETGLEIESPIYWNELAWAINGGTAQYRSKD